MEIRKFRGQGARAEEQGFALVVTLSLMVLLTIVAVGLLTLSSVSLRGSAAQGAKAVAQANARMALMLAIGELQRTTGPDQRITLTSSLRTVADASIGTFTGTTLSFDKRQPLAGDMTYAIQDSTDLGGLDLWAEVTNTPPNIYVNNSSTISYVLTPGAPPRNFIRLQVPQITP